jgi:hypothetical protein
MSFGLGEYPARSEQLATASRRLLDSFGDKRINRNIALQNLETATRTGDLAAEIRGFTEASPVSPSGGDRGGTRPPAPATSEDALAGVLLELQSANVLISAGIALNEHEGGADVTLLSEAVQHVETSRADVTRPLSAAELRFDPAANVTSPDIDAARKNFRENAEGVLGDIVDDTASVITIVFDKMKKVDGAAVLQGIQDLGGSFQLIFAAGRFIREGLARLKSAMDALTNLFGKDAIASVRNKVKGIWDRFVAGDFTHDAVAWLLDIDGARQRLDLSLSARGLTIDGLDAATNELPALSAAFKKNVKLCRALIAGVVFAGAVIGYLHLAAPWIPVALAGVYGGLIAGAILIGMNYAGSGRLLHWMRGVAVIADELKPPAPVA